MTKYLVNTSLSIRTSGAPDADRIFAGIPIPPYIHELALSQFEIEENADQLAERLAQWNCSSDEERYWGSARYRCEKIQEQVAGLMPSPNLKPIGGENNHPEAVLSAIRATPLVEVIVPEDSNILESDINIGTPDSPKWVPYDGAGGITLQLQLMEVNADRQPILHDEEPRTHRVSNFVGVRTAWFLHCRFSVSTQDS